MRKSFFTVIMVLASIGVITVPASGKENRDPVPSIISIRIMHTNDIHGHILPETDWSVRSKPRPKKGGAGALATAIGQYRKSVAFGKKPDIVLYLDAGDIFQGTPEGTLTAGRPMVEFFNMMKLDVMTAGNHDFDLGRDVLRKLVDMAQFPVVTANVIDVKTGKVSDGMIERTLIEREYKDPADGKKKTLKIGVFGVLTDDMPHISAKQNIKGLEFKDPVATSCEQVRLLKEESADIIFAVNHAGTEYDTRIAQSCTGVAVIVGGHSPTPLSPHILVKNRESLMPTVIVHTGGHAQNLGIVDLLFEVTSKTVLQSNSKLVRLYETEFKKDRKLEKWAEGVRNEVGKKLEIVIATSDTQYKKKADEECVIGNLIADAVRRPSGSDAAFMNNRGIRNIIPKGDVTLRDVFNIMPFDNTIITMTLTGTEILELLEQSASLYRDLLHMSGVKMKIDYRNPEGQRVLEASIGGAPVDPNKEYRVAANSFIAEGGDHFSVFTKGRDRKDNGYLQRDAIRDELILAAKKNNGVYSEKPEGRIVIVGHMPGTGE